MEKLQNFGLVFLIRSQTLYVESHLPGLHSLNSKISMLSYVGSFMSLLTSVAKKVFYI